MWPILNVIYENEIQYWLFSNEGMLNNVYFVNFETHCPLFMFKIALQNSGERFLILLQGLVFS